jgi:hypothetical protein
MASCGITKPEPIQIKGLNGKGAIPINGTPVGSTIFGAINVTSGANETANFESVTTVNGQIQQISSTNLSANEYWIYAIRGG